jgi:hypothetical protein
MKRLAIFVEGQTELHFVQRLIEEIAGYGLINFELKILRAGAIHDLRSVGPDSEIAEMNIMIVDCGGDGSVKSAILERADLLASRGYSEVIGLLDLFPKQLDNLEKYEQGLAVGLDDKEIKIRIFVAVKEIEAWFVDEFTHFARVCETLTPERVFEISGYNPREGCAEVDVNHPASLIKVVYKAVGRDYRKREADTFRILSNIDFGEIYLSVKERSRSLSKFIDGVEGFMGVSTVSEIGAAAD